MRYWITPRFISDSACRYAKLQSDIIRKYVKPGDFITTNGLFSNLDNQRMAGESLDFIMYDSYPNFAFTKENYEKFSATLQDRMWSRNLTEVRAVSPNFGIMEQQSGANGWNNRMAAPTPKPGTDDPVDHAERGPWSGLCQLFPLADLYYGDGDLLARDSGLFRKGEPETAGDSGNPQEIPGHFRSGRAPGMRPGRRF